jgi:hypothetical protein
MSTVGDSVARLAAAWAPHGVEFGTGAIEAYLWGLDDLDAASVERAVLRSIRTHRWHRPPTVAEIRDLVAEEQLRLPAAGTALVMVERHVSYWLNPAIDPCEACRATGVGGPDGELCVSCKGHGDVVRPLPALPVPVRRALDALGGCRGWRDADASVVRGQFRRLYEEFRADAVREVTDPPLLLQAAGHAQLGEVS